ncbi:class I SAM-dependent methyltransferase [Faunimonas sp. B44]|uniref:class I SAM-dependent methyltransferase n=1 Tax=Faunimonas sp. B44 TaxID=3461493 RepID=UPI00404418A4
MAATAFELWANRIAFAARQSARVAWYAGHGAAMRRLVRRVEAEGAAPRRPIAPPSRPVPGMGTLLGDVAALLARDLANVEAGRYPPPEDGDGDLPALLERSRAFFRDVPEVARRRNADRHQEVLDEVGAAASRRPRYYMQNFHFQTGGWMTEESARLYDMQVEVLFSGAANAMRRQALVPIAAELAGRDQRRVAFADIACGPGTFLTQLRRTFPRLPALAIDLSEPYLAEARRRLGRTPQAYPVVAKAEALPLADGALDLATSIYLFHELPPKIRRAVAGEMARVMKPGGLLVVVDSLQTGDEPRYDGLLELFPRLFHEPYFAGYLGDRLEAVFADAGFDVEGTGNAFLSKIVQLRRRTE